MAAALANSRFADEELRAMLMLLAGSGMIQRLDFGGFILAAAGGAQSLRRRRGAEGAEISAEVGLHLRGRIAGWGFG